ncbi:YecA family protein [Paenibacillus sp. PL91]|uniref:YecA family protein n=1 Tax=Paenibacillus sp. PL91 TaxID=2729538 RepID=UPI00145EADAD|nr:SEC-C metal-binding domain-containing protein [Paenibacillus sp. PL91]MBC9204994.1 SEC-C domain-containing protein [Paenibacillus sp. PL91]
MTTKLDKAMEKFWPQLTYPLTYADALGTLSKQQLTSIRTNLQISNLSSLNKQGLVEKLSELIPENINIATRCFDHNRWKLVQKIVKNDGIWDKPLLELQQYEYFRERGILFPSTVDGKQVVLMPSELVAFLKEGNLIEEQSNVNRNTEWVRMTQGLLYYYGVLSLNELREFVSTEADGQLAVSDFMSFLIEASAYYDQIVIDNGDNNFVYDYRAADPQAIMKERALRHDLDFCPFTKQQLVKAGEPDYVERSSQYMNLVRYVLDRYEIDREEADLMAEECVDATKNGASLASVIEIAKRFIDIPNMQTLTAITNLIVPLMNSTKQWAIKGHSPEELAAKRASVSMLLNGAPTKTVQADVIDIQSKKKIGRNDPCLCGSGKKHKKCCG